MKKTTLFFLSIAMAFTFILGFTCSPSRINQITTVSEEDLITEDIVKPTVLVLADTGSGTGVVIYQDKKHAFILTARHVIKDCKEFHIRQAFKDGLEYESATLVMEDKTNDLAILESAPVWLGVAKIIKDDSDIILFSKGFTYGFTATWRAPLNGILTEGRITILHDYSGSSRESTVTSIPVSFGNSGGGLFIKKDGHYLLAGIAHYLAAFGNPHDPNYILHICGFGTGEQMLTFLETFKNRK